MPLYQRRRPSPIQIWPTRVRRQDDVQSPDSPDSPDSTGSPSPTSSSSPKSPESPQSSSLAVSTQTSSSSTSLPPPSQTAAPSSPPPQVTSQAATTTAAPQQTAASSASSAPSPPPPPPPPQSTSEEPPRTTAAATPASTSAPASSAKESPSSTKPATSLPPALPVLSPSQDSNSVAASPTPTPSSSFATKPASSRPSQSISTSPSTGLPASSANSALVPVQSELDGEKSGIGRHRYEDHEKPIISKGAEAAAITLSVMGFIALVVGIVFFLKRRRKRQNESSLRHAEDAFNPGNNGSLHAPETAHVGYDGVPPSLGHITKVSNISTALFGGEHYRRPETVSTRSGDSRVAPSSRIAPPQPTPNPFADPPRNKAYDQLRGRPRSTTLTDRGSWVKNPFKDPASERFDPFGEMQEKARAERRRYVEEARREAEGKRRREDEQGFGLQVPAGDVRKGSDVTVGGIGVLDRSGDGRWS